MSALRIERLAEGHFGALAALFGRVFRRNPGEAVLRAKYDTAHAGLRHVSFLALDGERVVAFVGMLPQLFELDGRAILAAQACDYATDPAYRRRGLFRELEGRGREAAVQGGAELVWAWPHDESLAVSLRTGWRVLSTSRRTAIRVRTIPLARAAFRSRGSWSAYSRWALREALRRYPPADGRPNSLAREGWLCQRYDDALERYRSFSTNCRLDLGGVTAWIRLGPQLLVGDMDAPDRASVAEATGSLVALARRLGVQDVMFMTSPGTLLHEAVTSLYPGSPAWAVAVGEARVPVDRLRVNLADYDTF